MFLFSLESSVISTLHIKKPSLEFPVVQSLGWNIFLLPEVCIEMILVLEVFIL